jgi:hypothetical protein
MVTQHLFMFLRYSTTVVQNFATFWVGMITQPVLISSEDALTTPETDDFNPFEECGSTKTCFGVPNNCYNTGNCRLFGAVIPNANDTFTFEMLSKSKF